VPRSFRRKRPAGQSASAPAERLCDRRRRALTVQREAAKAALAEIFRDPDRIHIRHDLWLETLRQKARLTEEDLKVVAGAAEFYLDRGGVGPIPELWQWAGWGEPTYRRRFVPAGESSSRDEVGAGGAGCDEGSA
jgi:hypothetical protein